MTDNVQKFRTWGRLWREGEELWIFCAIENCNWSESRSMRKLTVHWLKFFKLSPNYFRKSLTTSKVIVIIMFWYGAQRSIWKLRDKFREVQDSCWYCSRDLISDAVFKKLYHWLPLVPTIFSIESWRLTSVLLYLLETVIMQP